MLSGAWAYTATPASSLFVGIVTVALLVVCGFHREPGAPLNRLRIASVFVTSAATYTFCILAWAQIVCTISLSRVIAHGFGDERIAWLLVAVTFDGVLRIWDEFRPGQISA